MDIFRKTTMYSIKAFTVVIHKAKIRALSTESSHRDSGHCTAQVEISALVLNTGVKQSFGAV